MSVAAKALDIAPGATSATLDMPQSGARRPAQGAFVITVYEGQPLGNGSGTMGTVK